CGRFGCGACRLRRRDPHVVAAATRDLDVARQIFQLEPSVAAETDRLRERVRVLRTAIVVRAIALAPIPVRPALLAPLDELSESVGGKRQRVVGDALDVPFQMALRSGWGRRHGERVSDENPGDGFHWFIPDMMRAAPSWFPLRISLIKATVSCSSCSLLRSASNRLSWATAFAGSVFNAARLCPIASSMTARFACTT